mmetsp:Transcript_8084/g.12372  ORF Transcript_8084/g.12372 Transcript_8084/m.12372 type:complete len:95 (+) Transcript_8084:104-388(+)
MNMTATSRHLLLLLALGLVQNQSSAFVPSTKKTFVSTWGSEQQQQQQQQQQQSKQEESRFNSYGEKRCGIPHANVPQFSERINEKLNLHVESIL